MNYASDEETLRESFKQAYKQVSPPSGAKELIEANILVELNSSVSMNDSPLVRPQLMVPMLASIAGCLIAYGFWLSMSFI